MSPSFDHSDRLQQARLAGGARVDSPASFADPCGVQFLRALDSHQVRHLAAGDRGGGGLGIEQVRRK
jgi:hypothetical protein